MTSLSIIVPTLNEASNIAATLAPLQAMRARGAEIILVDAQSTDNTVAIAAPLVDQALTSERGRATQIAMGASRAAGEWLLFLHADSLPPPDADLRIRDAVQTGAEWGRFDITIRGEHFMFVVIAWFINRRSRLTGIATGDQGIFVSQALLARIGGMPRQPLMEDVELCARLRRVSPPACLPDRMVTSGRRWEKHGIWRTILLMWRLRYAYWRGADPAELHRLYYG